MDIIFSKLKPYYKVVYDLCEARLQGSAFPVTNNFLEASRAAHKDQVSHLLSVVAIKGLVSLLVSLTRSMVNNGDSPTPKFKKHGVCWSLCWVKKSCAMDGFRARL